jgi:hypothetical protein
MLGAPFFIVGREALEIMFITLMIMTFIKLNWSMITSAFLGIIAGAVIGWQMSNLLAPYEGLMYGILSALMFYLFFSASTVGQQIVNSIEKVGSAVATSWAGLITMFIIFARESSEIFIFMLMPINNTWNGWFSASIAVVLIAGMFPLIKHKVPANVLFKITRYAFLVFAIWFGYEAIMHYYSITHAHVVH